MKRILAVSILMFSAIVLAQQPNNAQPPNNNGNDHPATPTAVPSEPVPPPTVTPVIVGGQDPVTRQYVEIGIGVAILVVGLLIVMAEIGLMCWQKRFWDAYSYRIVGLTIVVHAALLSIVAGFGQQQTAPLMGLLGTIAGYMLADQREQGTNAGNKQ